MPGYEPGIAFGPGSAVRAHKQSELLRRSHPLHRPIAAAGHRRFQIAQPRGSPYPDIPVSRVQ